MDDALSSTSKNPVQNKVIKNTLDAMNSNFQDGCDSIVQAVTAKGSTPASSSLNDIITAIESISVGGQIPADYSPLVNALRDLGYDISMSATPSELAYILQNEIDYDTVSRYYYYKYIDTPVTLSSYVDYTKFDDRIQVHGLTSSGLSSATKTVTIPDYSDGLQIEIG